MITKKTVKRHRFFISSCAMVLVALCFLGYVLSGSVSSTQAFDQLPQKNGLFLWVCRGTVYALLFFMWTPFLRYTSRVSSTPIEPQRFNTLRRYRYKFIVMIVVYEGLIVQNLMGIWMSGL